METNKLFISGLSWDLDWQEIKDIFKEYGEVSFVKIIKDRETGKSKGFGFVEFSSVKEAVVAKNAMNGAKINDRTIKIDFAKEKNLN